MNSNMRLDLFAEDRAHEEFLRAMIMRVSRDEGKFVDIRTISSRGGHGRALAEFELYQQATEKIRGVSSSFPELVVVAIDCNCSKYSAAKTAILSRIYVPFKNITIIACPDPHIERWYLADPDSFEGVVGIKPKLGKKKCKRDLYKRILSKAVSDAGYPPTLSGVEFAPDIVEEMDLHKAGRNEKSLKHFIDSLNSALRLA